MFVYKLYAHTSSCRSRVIPYVIYMYMYLQLAGPRAHVLVGVVLPLACGRSAHRSYTWVSLFTGSRPEE